MEVNVLQFVSNLKEIYFEILYVYFKFSQLIYSLFYISFLFCEGDWY